MLYLLGMSVPLILFGVGIILYDKHSRKKPSSGSGAYTVPEGTSSVQVTIVGAGGGGGNDKKYFGGRGAGGGSGKVLVEHYGLDKKQSKKKSKKKSKSKKSKKK